MHRLPLVATLLSLAAPALAKSVWFTYAGGDHATERLTPRRRAFDAPVTITFRSDSLFGGTLDPLDRLTILPRGDVLVRTYTPGASVRVSPSRGGVRVSVGDCARTAKKNEIRCATRLTVDPFTVRVRSASGAAATRTPPSDMRFAVQLHALDEKTGKHYSSDVELLSFAEGGVTPTGAGDGQESKHYYEMDELAGYFEHRGVPM